MKKMFLMMCAVAAMVTCASCCGKCDDKKACEQDAERPACCQKDEHQARHAEMRAKWEKFDELSEEEQVALIAERKACIDKHRAKRAELEAKRAELDAKWEKFDELSLAEQKALIDEMDALCPRPRQCEKKCGAQPEGGHKCCKGGEKKCGAQPEGDHKCCKGGEKPACQH